MTSRGVWITVLVMCGACGSGAEPDRQPALLEDADEVWEAVDSDSVAMPAFPAARRGRLVVASDGAFKLDGRWAARADVCADPPMFQLIAKDDTVGVIVLVALADSGDGTGLYEAGQPDDETGTQAPARVGIQLFQRQGAFAFRAVEGQVTLESLDRRTSGRMQVVMREVMREADVAVAAVFDAIPVTSLSAEECRLVLAAEGN